MARYTTTVLTVEQIREKLEFDRRGERWVHPDNRVGVGIQGNPISSRPEDAEAPKPKELRQLLDQLLKKHDIEPANELIKMAVEKDADGRFILDTDQRIKIWTELLQYRMPKLKAVEVSGEIDHSITVVVRRFGDDAIMERNASRPLDTPINVEVKKLGE